MTLLHMDGFDLGDEDLKFLTAVAGSTSGASPRFGYGRYWQDQNGGTGSVAITASSLVTVGVALRFVNSGPLRIHFQADSGATTHVTIWCYDSGMIEARLGSATSGTLLGSSRSLAAGNVWNYVEAQVSVADAGGTVKVRANGSSTNVIDFTGDTKNAGTSTNIDRISLGPSGVSSDVDLDDFYILNSAGSTNTTFLGDVRICALSPNAAGFRTEMTAAGGTGANYEHVDEKPYSTTDYVAGDTAGEGDLYNIESLPVTPTTIFAVQNNVIAAKDDSGTRSVKPMIRIGGTTYNGSTSVLSTAYDLFSTIYETNPNSGVAWTNANIDDLQIGAETV